MPFDTTLRFENHLTYICFFESDLQSGYSQRWLDAPLHGIAIDVRGCKGGEGGGKGGEALPSSSDIKSCDPPDQAQFCNAHPYLRIKRCPPRK